MARLSEKSLLAVAAIVDIAIHSRGQPVAAKALAERHNLPPRHLEPVLQALVRSGILRGIRGPQGGYEMARDQGAVTAEDILTAAGNAEEAEQPALASDLVNAVVRPALAGAEHSFSTALRQITVADMVKRAPQPV